MAARDYYNSFATGSFASYQPTHTAPSRPQQYQPYSPHQQRPHGAPRPISSVPPTAPPSYFPPPPFAAPPASRPSMPSQQQPQQPTLRPSQPAYLSPGSGILKPTRPYSYSTPPDRPNRHAHFADSPSPSRSRSRSHSRSGSRHPKHHHHHRHSNSFSHFDSRDHCTYDGYSRNAHSHKTPHKDMDTFLGASGGALIGDAIFPGLGTIGGLLLGGLGGRKFAEKRKSTHRRERAESGCGSGNRDERAEERYESGKSWRSGDGEYRYKK